MTSVVTINCVKYVNSNGVLDESTLFVSLHNETRRTFFLDRSLLSIKMMKEGLDHPFWLFDETFFFLTFTNLLNLKSVTQNLKRAVAEKVFYDCTNTLFMLTNPKSFLQCLFEQ